MADNDIKTSKKRFAYSTVAEWVKKEDFQPTAFKVHRYNSIILKEVEGLGYKRISYLIYEKGYRGFRSNSVLRNNDIYTIYQKGKIREERINREFKTVVSGIVVYEYSN